MTVSLVAIPMAAGLASVDSGKSLKLWGGGSEAVCTSLCCSLLRLGDEMVGCGRVGGRRSGDGPAGLLEAAFLFGMLL